MKKILFFCFALLTLNILGQTRSNLVNVIQWQKEDTVKIGALAGWKVPYSITVLSVSAFTDADSATFNIEERLAGTPNSAGDSLFKSSMVAVTTGKDSTSFSGSGGAVFAQNTWLTPNIKAKGTNTKRFSLTIRYAKNY